MASRSVRYSSDQKAHDSSAEVDHSRRSRVGLLEQVATTFTWSRISSGVTCS
jgi:hypothetical protein